MFKCKICGREITNKGGLVVHEKTCEKIFNNKEEINRLYINEFYSVRDLCRKYNVGKGIICEVLGDSIRNYSESRQIVNNKYPFSHSEKSKDKIRKKRLDFMKKNPEKTSWRQKNMSYPEKIFLNKITEIGWDKKYTIAREFSVFPFFIDFAFMNEMVAVEIDGSQHLLVERKKKDEIKDNLLILNGWSVIRISENEIKKNIDYVIEYIEDVLLSLSKEKKYELGFLKPPKSRYKKIRLENGLTPCEKQRMINGRKIARPSYDELKKLVDINGFLGTGKIYGVSDNSIRNWLMFYSKYGE